MDEKTLEALRGSIAKWEGIVAGTISNHGANNCPLCQMFLLPRLKSGATFKDQCTGCPVSARTGKSHCDGTPYEDVEACEEEYDEGAGEFRAAAQAELDFLKGLLPTDALTQDKHDG